MVKTIIVAAILVIAATDLCAQFRHNEKVIPFDFKRTELGMAYSLVGGDEYLTLNAALPASKHFTVGTRACIRLNRERVTSWSSNFQRIYSSMYYLYSRFETGIDITYDIQMNFSTTLGMGVADRFDDVPCYWESAVQPVLLLHPDVSLLMKLAHNYHASVSFAIMHSPTLETENIINIPKPMLGFNIRVYPWQTL